VVQAPPDVLALVEQREAARTRRDWAQSDILRHQAAALGWQIRDTPAGPVVESLR
jgi:cysteinyl-tRNA synthetase